MKNIILVVTLCLTLAGCAGVRQQDLNAWVGKPIEALDTHSFFLTLPMIKTKTDSGIEIRNYMNRVNIGHCGSFGNVFGNGSVTGNTSMSHANFSGFQNCVSRTVGCDNIFYIKNRKIIEYKPVGRCMTNETVQPEARYLELMK